MLSLPNFLIVGAQKSGTTSLHSILSVHPQVNMSQTKEINFFTNPKNYRKGLKHYSSYFNQPDEDQIVTGEASPGYMCYPDVAGRILDDLGSIRIVMILRDPVKRAYSQYWDNRRHLSEPNNIDEIVTLYLSDNYNPVTKGYFSRGVYINYVHQYEKLFGRENLHIIILEKLIKTPREELHRLYNFLGVEAESGLADLPHASNASLIWNNPFYNYLLAHPGYTRFIHPKFRRLFFWGKKRKYQYSLPDEGTIIKLKDFYRDYNKQLEEFLMTDLSEWN